MIFYSCSFITIIDNIKFFYGLFNISMCFCFSIMYINPYSPPLHTQSMMSTLLHGSYTLVLALHIFLLQSQLYKPSCPLFYGISFTQVNSCHPSLSFHINKMVCCCFNLLLPIYPYMVNCMCYCTEYFLHFFKSCLTIFYIP